MQRHRRPISQRGEGTRWDSSNLKPVAIALAVAITICAIPLAYRIFNCQSFDAGFSLQQLFSFKCSAAPLSPTVTEGVSSEALAAQPLAWPKGYISYRVNGGIARPSASVTPASGGRAPMFADVPTGLVLQATAEKVVRTRPYATSASTKVAGGRCFRVIDGDRIADETPTAHMSGGWLPVQVLDACP
jgi:hypothetical protein